MKNIYLLVFTISFVCFSAIINGQNGPGGIGNSTDNILWLDANNLSLNDGDPVSTWADTSGNGNNATQISATNQPIYNTNTLNGFPAITFDGSNDYLDLDNHITTSALTAFSVFKANNSGGKTIIEIKDHLLLGRNIEAYVDYNTRFSISKGTLAPAIYSLTSSSVASSNFLMTCRLNSSTQSRTSFHSSSTSSIGGKPGSTKFYFNGFIPEILLYNRELNSAERTIVLNYLSSKYDLLTLNDRFAFESGEFYRSLIGLGQEADGSNTEAIDRDSTIKISNASSLSNGDYLLIANNDGDLLTSPDVPVGYTERWNRVWRADTTGTPGTISIEFFLGSNGFASPLNYVILIEDNDGDFTNGDVTVHSAGLSYSAVSNSVEFTNVSLPKGAYFTLAEVDGFITSANSGSWQNPNSWSCNCIPDTNDIVSIISPHVISVDSNANITDLTIENGASLDFDGMDTLKIHRDLTFDIGSTFIENDGTISAISEAGVQAFSNNSNSRIELNNLHISNTSGLELSSGGWAIHNSLQVEAGGMDVSSADSVVLISNETYTSQILESMDGAFTGDFIVQRYIGTRNANYGNLGSPIEGATMAQWDDDLFISGINGNDGNAQSGGGGTFYSIWSYYPPNGQNGSIQSVNESINPGQGYEVYLASNLNTFDATTIDYVGVPNTGELASYMLTQKGWNLFSNQFHAHVAYDSVDKVSWIPTEYYIFNTDNGSYDFITGDGKPLLAPGQGFWINSNAAGKAFEFKEKDKVASTSSSFLRTKSTKVELLNFSLSCNSNQFKHNMMIDFSPYSTSEIDEKDAYYLKSPLEEVPAIYTLASNSNEGLIKNSISNLEESHLIPMIVYTGENSDYELEVDNIDKAYENYSCMYLMDNENQKVIDLTMENKYEFEGVKGKENSFSLVLSNSYASCEDLIKSNTSNVFTQKLDQNINLRNASFNNWYIDYTLGNEETPLNIKVFNINGQEVIAPVSWSASGSGTYKVQGLEDLDGIFLIQIKSDKQVINKTIKL